MFFTRRKGLTFVDRGDMDSPDFETASFTADEMWRELDLSGIVPAGITLLHAYFFIMTPDTESQMKIRNADHNNNHNVLSTSAGVANGVFVCDGLVTCNAARKIKYNLVTGVYPYIAFYIRGWFV